MAAAAGGRPASVPLQPLPCPAALVSDGARLDGRGLEEFRSVCECFSVVLARLAVAVVRVRERGGKTVDGCSAAQRSNHPLPPTTPTHPPQQNQNSSGHQSHQQSSGFSLRRVQQHQSDGRCVSSVELASASLLSWLQLEGTGVAQLLSDRRLQLPSSTPKTAHQNEHTTNPSPSNCNSYGPRQGERKFGFTDMGRLNVEVSFTSFARPERQRQAQVRRCD